MTQTDDRFWQLAMAATAPTADELQQAEADLAALEPVPALPADRIAALVAPALAARAAAAATAAAAAASRRTGRRVLVVAATLLLSLTMAAVAVKLWSGQHSDRTLDFAIALRVAADRGQTEAERDTALGRIDDHCGYAVAAVLDLVRDPEPTIASAALTVRADLFATTGTRAAPTVKTTTNELLSLLAVAQDRQLPTPRRLAALRQVGQAAAAGIRAIVEANLTEPTRKRKREEVLQRLRQELGQ